MAEHTLQRDSPLFDKFIPMQILFSTPSAESNPNPHSQDSKISNLVLRIINGTRSMGTIGAQVERLVHFEITDEQDPYFYYYMDVGEQDFHQFKRDQHILVEFSIFPLKIIELIHLCLSQPATESSNILSSGTSTFIAKLDISAIQTSGSGVFSIVEVNMFKQLTHISLLLKPGDDAAVKMYLASRLHLSMELAQRQSEDISRLKEELLTSRQTNEEIDSELAQLRTMKNVEMQSLTAEHAKELSQLQRQAMESCEQLRVRYEAQAEAARSTNDTFQKDLITKTAAFDRQLSDVLQEKGELEFKLRDALRSSQTVEVDRDRLLKECDDLIARVRQLTEEKSMLQKDAIRLDSKAEGLLQQLKDRDESMSKSAQLQKASEEAKNAAEQRLQAELRAGDTLREELRQAASAMDRMEQMIVKLQGSSSSQKEKIKVKSEVIRRQEAAVTELRAKLNDVEIQLSATKDSLSLSGSQADSLRKQLADSEARAKEREQVLANQQDVITYLNDEITRSQVGIRKSPTTAAVSVATSIPSQQPLHLYTPQRAPTSAFKSPISAISMTGSDTPHLRHERDATHQMKNLMHTHSLGVTYSDIQSNITEDSIKGFGTTGFKDLTEENVYLRGLRNLGLASAMKSEGLDAALLQDFTQQMSYQASSSSFTEDNVQHKTVDLESLDYYALDMLPKAATSSRSPAFNSDSSSRSNRKKEATDRDLLAIQPGRRSGGLTRKTYAWEEEDFGLDPNPASAQVS